MTDRDFPRRYEGRVVKVRILPPRTSVIITGVDQEGYAIVGSYKCLDCKLSTPYVGVMLAHQKDPGLWHRLRRQILRASKEPKITTRPVTLGGKHAYSHQHSDLS